MLINSKSNNVNAQNNYLNSELVIEGRRVYNSSGSKLTGDDLTEYMKSNPDALCYLKRARTSRDAGTALYVLGMLTMVATPVVLASTLSQATT